MVGSTLLGPGTYEGTVLKTTGGAGYGWKITAVVSCATSAADTTGSSIQGRRPTASLMLVVDQLNFS